MPEVEIPLNLQNPASAAGENSTGASILVIDDESAIRESLEVLLTLEGYAVRMANDGEQGLRVLELENFDLVLLDLALPRDIEPAAATLPGVTLIDLDVIGAAAGQQDAPDRKSVV